MTDPAATAAKMKKIRALLNQAENAAATEHEAETFRAKAFELMAAHGVEMAMLAAEEPHTDRPEGRTIDVRHPWAREGALLLAGVARSLRCRAVRLRNRPGEPQQIRVLGFASDLDRLDVLYTSLLLQMHSGLLSETVPPGASPRAWRRSWLLGFTHQVTHRITAAEKRAQQDTTATTSTGRGADLVLADRSARVLQLQADEFPHLIKGSRTRYTGTGFRQGVAAGARADIGEARITNHGRDSLER